MTTRERVRNYLDTKVTDSQQVVCGGCGLGVHDQDARFCKQCGTPLES